MGFKDFLNTFVEEAVLEGYPVEMSVSLLLSESARSLDDNSTVLEMLKEEFGDELFEVYRRAGPRRIAKRKVRTARRPSVRKLPKRKAGGGMRGQKRIRRKVAGGGRILIRKQGRVNPIRSIRMRRSKAKRSQAAKRASRNPQTKMKRKRTMAVRARMLPSKKKRTTSYRGFHGAKRHAAPRRTARPRPRRR
jgi:hypothetical protein